MKRKKNANFKLPSEMFTLNEDAPFWFCTIALEGIISNAQETRLLKIGRIKCVT